MGSTFIISANGLDMSDSDNQLCLKIVSLMEGIEEYL
jgi:hypothetical protein